MSKLTAKQLKEMNDRLDFIIQEATAAKKSVARKRRKQALDAIRISAIMCDDMLENFDREKLLRYAMGDEAYERNLPKG